MTLALNREVRFPNLKPGEYQVTSDETPEYNCIAWAAGDSTRLWAPVHGLYWPESAPREETLAGFRAVFESLGYQDCSTDDLEPDFERIAIFVDAEGVPTHVARQLENGKWTSKLGSWEDIEHEHLHALAGSASMYGIVSLIMRRPRESAVN